MILLLLVLLLLLRLTANVTVAWTVMFGVTVLLIACVTFPVVVIVIFFGYQAELTRVQQEHREEEDEAAEVVEVVENPAILGAAN